MQNFELSGAIFCNVSANNITGTGGLDFLSGANYQDTIEGLAGPDHLEGLGGNDILYGGRGDDFIHGDSGADVMYGGRGNDRLDDQFGYGDDKLFGGPGRDSLIGRGGDDVMYPSHGGPHDSHPNGPVYDYVDPGPGADYIVLEGPLTGFTKVTHDRILLYTLIAQVDVVKGKAKTIKNFNVGSDHIQVNLDGASASDWGANGEYLTFRYKGKTYKYVRFVNRSAQTILDKAVIFD